MADQRTPAEERADWGAWLDRFEREILPAFTARGYSKEAAAVIYFTRLPAGASVIDEDADEDDDAF